MPTPIVMPSLGMYTIEGELTRWLVPDGAAVERDQPVLELTTEKAVVEVNAPAPGVLYHALPERGRVQVQGLLGYVLAPGEAPPVGAVGPPHPPAPSPGAHATGQWGEGEQGSAIGRAAQAAVLETSPLTGKAAADRLPPSPLVGEGPGVRGPASPLARRRAAALGVDLSQVTGTGPGGRITEADVEAAARQAALVLRRSPLSGMRGMIAHRMHQSLATTAQLTLTREIDATPLVAARDALAAAAPDVRVSYDAFLARALAAALTAHPALNAVVEGDEILVLREVHVGVAVALDDGLVVPVLGNPARRPVLDLARDLEALAARARAGRLRPQDMESGTVTLTNLGGYGVDTFTPILNPPQSAILGVGRIAPRPFVASDGRLDARPTVHLSLTFDHRVADGATAAALLDTIASHCAAPPTD